MTVLVSTAVALLPRYRPPALALVLSTRLPEIRQLFSSTLPLPATLMPEEDEPEVLFVTVQLVKVVLALAPTVIVLPPEAPVLAWLPVTVQPVRVLVPVLDRLRMLPPAVVTLFSSVSSWAVTFTAPAT